MEKQWINYKDFSICIQDDRFDVALDGVSIFALPVRSSVPANGKQDVDEDILVREIETAGDGVSVRWRTRSSLWSEKTYLLDVTSDSFLYRIQVSGKGAPDEIQYFSGVPADRWGAQYEAAGYLVPMSASGIETYTRSIAQDGELNLHFMVPPMYCYPFWMEDCDTWFGLGLAAKPGQYNFERFIYHNHRERFHLSVPLFGHTQVDGVWEAPGILGCPGRDGLDVLKNYSAWHYRNQYANPLPHRESDWWYGPFFCGWGEQAPMCGKYNASIFDMASQKVYTEMSEHLDALDLHPTAIIIDDKWQRYYGEALPDPEKWPDMRAFVEQEHKKGRRVVLWFKSWNCEGLPADECITLWSQPVSADPTNPKYQDRMRKTIHTLLSSDEGCYNCDGFKIDFADCLPRGKDVKAYEPGVYGVEMLKRLYRLLYDSAKAAKPDALINCSNCHPYLAETTDQVRLHDYDSRQRSVKSVMKFRMDITEAALPGVSVDTDFPAFGNHRDSMAYIRYAPSLGVPDLYRLSPIEGSAFTDEDWREIRAIWKRYAENRKRQP